MITTKVSRPDMSCWRVQLLGAETVYVREEHLPTVIVYGGRVWVPSEVLVEKGAKFVPLADASTWFLQPEPLHGLPS